MNTVSFKEYHKELMKIRNEVGPDMLVSIAEVFDYGQPVQLGVNWASIGTIPADQAKEFGQRIIAAAEAVENFKYNGFIVRNYV